MKPLEPPFIKIIINFATQEQHDIYHYMSYNKDWIFEQIEKILKKIEKNLLKNGKKSITNFWENKLLDVVRSWYEKKLSHDSRFQGQ